MGWEVGSGVAVVVVVVVVVVVHGVASVSGAVLTHGNTKLEGRVKHIILVHNIDHAYLRIDNKNSEVRFYSDNSSFTL